MCSSSAACTPDGSGVTYNESINIATAVAMPDGGLITPVLKNADSTDIYTMSRNWADLVRGYVRGGEGMGAWLAAVLQLGWGAMRGPQMTGPTFGTRVLFLRGNQQAAYRPKLCALPSHLSFPGVLAEPV